VQVIVCDHCGYSECASGGYAHVAQTPRYVVWTLPQVDETDRWSLDQYEGLFALRQHGLVLFRRSEWDAWAADRQWMPASSELSQLNAKALSDAWRWTMPARFRAPAMHDLPEFIRANAVACDLMTIDEAIDHLWRLVHWLERDTQDTVVGDFRRIGPDDAPIARIYFDAAEFDEWPSFSLAPDRPLLTFSREWCFQPSAV